MQASINNNKKINCSINCNQNVNCSINSTNNIQAITCAQNDINANSTQRGPQGIPGEAATIQLGTVTTGAAGSDVIITNSGTENAAVFNFTIPRGDRGEQGEQGIQGETGNGIVSIEKTSTSGLVDTYTITFDNGNTETFTVTNGQKGDTGSAATISVGSTTTGAAGTSASVTNSGTSSAAVLDFVIPKGDTGATGATGNGISSIAKTSTSGLVDTYTITFTNGTTTTFTVTNGQDGTGASSVSELTDVDLTGLSNGDVLIYNSTSQEWEAGEIQGGVTDVQVNGSSVMDGTVAKINLSTYATKTEVNAKSTVTIVDWTV